MAEDTTSTSTRAKRADRKYEVIVRRLDENKDVPIQLTINGDRKRFMPDTKVELTKAQIDTLRSAVEDVRIQLPLDSAVYESANPRRMAEGQYPGFTAITNKVDGTITMVKRNPLYAVETML